VAKIREANRAGLRFSEMMLECERGQRRGLLVTPTRELVIDRSRLERARVGDHSSVVDDAIVRSVEVWLEPIDAVVFRARSDDAEGHWCFADDLDGSEVEELGYQMMCSHISLYRRLVRRRVYAMIGTDLGEREKKAFEVGGRRLVAELERALPEAGEPERSMHGFDLWLLKNVALWSTRSLAECLRGSLSEFLDLFDARRQELAVMRSTLPLAKLD